MNDIGLVPAPLTPEHWVIVNTALAYLSLFVGMAITAAFSLLLAHSMIPSLIITGDSPVDINVFRRFLYPISVLAGAMAFYCFVRAMIGIVSVLQQIYPRFAI